MFCLLILFQVLIIHFKLRNVSSLPAQVGIHVVFLDRFASSRRRITFGYSSRHRLCERSEAIHNEMFVRNNGRGSLPKLAKTTPLPSLRGRSPKPCLPAGRNPRYSVILKCTKLVVDNLFVLVLLFMLQY